MVADSVAGRGWLRWASPLGWVENLRPLTGSQPLALVPIVLLMAAAAGAAILLAGRRDVGAAVLLPRRTSPRRRHPARLAAAVALPSGSSAGSSLAWIGGLALLALIFGVVARSAAGPTWSARAIEETVGRLGGQPRRRRAAWIGYEFLYLAALLPLPPPARSPPLRNEEADGHLDHLLARRSAGRAWLAGRLGSSRPASWSARRLATGIGGWIGSPASRRRRARCRCSRPG